MKSANAEVTQVTALTVVERAALAVRSTPELKKELATLAEGSKHITTITNVDGRAQVHAALMVLKNRRIDIEKIGKDARDDATKFSKAVIAEEDVLVALIQPEEDRLQTIRDEWDDRIEAARLAKVKAEQERQAAIQMRLTVMEDLTRRAVLFKTASEIEGANEQVRRVEIDESFAEFQGAATMAKEDALRRLTELHVAAKEREAESARLAAERAELDRKRVDQEARDAEVRRLREAEDANAREQQRQEREAFEKEQVRVRAEQAAESERIRKDREALEAAQKAEADRKAAEERQRQEAEDKGRRDAEQEAERQRKANFVPTLEQVCQVLAAHFEVTEERVLEWLPRLAKSMRKAA